MSYRISYDTSGRFYFNLKGKKSRILLLSCIFFLIFLLFVRVYWAEGHSVLNKLLWSGDIDMLDQAIRHVFLSVKQGQSFPLAVQSFCREIINEIQAIA